MTLPSAAALLTVFPAYSTAGQWPRSIRRHTNLQPPIRRVCYRDRKPRPPDTHTHTHRRWRTILSLKTACTEINTLSWTSKPLRHTKKHSNTFGNHARWRGLRAALLNYVKVFVSGCQVGNSLWRSTLIYSSFVKRSSLFFVFPHKGMGYRESSIT